ncbi:hypothetical protein PHYSODRAFT_521866 [Phytophthora sojae]|uniref:Uncharacterized protein n=1 Tax=Phytophthora sojae (strain P6497) TaxID=1094619 RepID=G5A4V6_PHYSP|nr:hypothetical protein PHYSODRAFT_521866 [Phytophthora sojae]EGZ09705.1 hypothetical protein PHYSODRAFT_521866 [Phytophthora sojae]|eukprot:XP_009534566.1 hypothetical protein PHYSODRAFT_521866 [Phytophthora sojae]
MEATTNAAGRPPRPRAHKPSSHGAWSSTYSPYAGPVRASPRTAKLAHQDQQDHVQPPPATSRPKRPLSASQVASTRVAMTSPRPNSARPARPNSATKTRYMQLETIAFPMQSPTAEEFSETCEACLSPSPSSPEAGVLQETDSAALHMKLQALLEMWGEEQLGFRSCVLFCETTFRQAKALASRMSRPNAFMSAVAYSCLCQMGSVLDEKYPFLNNIIDELGAALYSNFTDLKRHIGQEDQTQHQSAIFFEHGKPWFQAFLMQKMRCRSIQSSADASKNEVQLLTEMLQEARAANSSAVVTAAAAFQVPQRRGKLEEYYTPPALELGDLGLESLSSKVLKAFTALSDADARHLLALLLENAVERDMPKLPNMMATTVGHMKGQDRREFLRECFDYVTPSELQDALHERDEINDDKRYQALVGDLHELLQLQPHEDGSEMKNSPSNSVALFHSEEARIGKRVHELVELVEDVATEVAFFEPKHQALFPHSILQRLHEEKPQCECVCGRHRLIDSDGEDAKEEEVIPAQSEEKEPQEEEDAKKQKSRRKSTLKRPLSAPSGRRKNAISFNTRYGSPRKSSASIHVFPLAEVCHLLSSILHLQFSREAAEAPSNAGSGAVSTLTFDDHWAFLRYDSASRTFKTLAKDYLIRKYGIKSIAVMHTLQLERSLLHYTAKDNHVRCELFSWFFGADKTRHQSKDHAFAFFQRLVKSILNLYAIKKTVRSNSITITASTQQLQPLAYSALITMWTECIGDGEPTNPRTIPASLALETCKQTFPPAMQRNSHFTLFREKLHRRSVEQKTMDLEEFFQGAMTAWQLVFDAQTEEATKTLEGAGTLDLEGFAKCLITNGLEFTTGERYELFDLLTQDGDESVISSKKMVQFLMEAKYLRPAAQPSTLTLLAG